MAERQSRLDKQKEEFQRARVAPTELVEPTDAEARNGWTAEGLTAYLADQAASQTLRTDINSLQRRAARKPTRCNSKYRPLRWRG